MSQTDQSRVQPKKYLLLTYLGLFLLAFIPRAYNLSRFVTADEAKWVYRSAQFLAAFLQGDFSATSVNLTPAVTTTWLGSLGHAFYYWLHQDDLNQPLTEWLLSLPEFRTDLDLLVATRWPMVLFTSIGVVIIYQIARNLFSPQLAFIGAVFIALDPHTISLSRIIGHDAPATFFLTLSLLLMLWAITKKNPSTPKKSTTYLMILSGIAAGLAFLSKAPTLFLLPWAGFMFLILVWQDRSHWSHWFKNFLLWGLTAYLTFIIIWPAAWGDPIGRPWAVVENAFLSATDTEEAETENYWLVPDLGPFYYLVHGGFKLSPLVMVGLGLALLAYFRGWPSSLSPPSSKACLWLTIFVILFTLFMTLGEKRSPRYILPIFPALALLAAYGWRQIYHTRGPLIPAFILTLSAMVILLPHIPYYLTYYNPLLGGTYTAPHLVKIGWGEGLDRIGRFLQRELPDSRVGTAYSSTIAPFFHGDLSQVSGDHLDYIVLYKKQVQSGDPQPEFIRYYQQQGAIFSVTLAGIDYGGVYPGPALQKPISPIPGLLGYRALTPYGSIGQPLEIDLLWTNPHPASSSIPISLAPLSALNPSETELSPYTTGESQPTALTPEVIISHHILNPPENLERGEYALLLEDQPLGKIELRNFQLPSGMNPLKDTIFGNQIKLAAYQFEPTPDEIIITLAWQAQTNSLPDYTVFVQLLEAETQERITGVDQQPLHGTWPTPQWIKKEIVIDHYSLSIPPDIRPGPYKIIVGLYRPETGQRLPLAEGQDHWTLPWTFIRE